MRSTTQIAVIKLGWVSCQFESRSILITKGKIFKGEHKIKWLKAPLQHFEEF